MKHIKTKHIKFKHIFYKSSFNRWCNLYVLSWGPALLKLGWRNFNSKFPWYNRRSKRQSLLGTETARWDPSHGINKDCSKPEPVDWKLEALEYTTKITETHGNLTLWIHGNSINVLELMFCRIRRVFLLSSLVSFRIPNSMRTWPANISLNTRWPYSLLCHHFKFWNQCRHYFHCGYLELYHQKPGKTFILLWRRAQET